MECGKCGATAMIEGSLTESSSGGDINFCSSEVSTMKRMFAIGNRKVKAYACLRCSHLELMVELKEKDLKGYEQFEGPQPGVLERIANDET